MKNQISLSRYPVIPFVRLNRQTILVLCFLFLYSMVFAQVESEQAALGKQAEPQVTQQQTETKTEEQTAAVDSLTTSGNVTLDFKEADIRNVIKIISYKSGVNIVSTPEVIGNITIRLVDVPWEKALDTIVKTYSFGYEWLNNKVIMVSTLEKLAQQRKAQQDAAEMEPIDTKTFILNFSKAEEIKNSLKDLISAKGKITLEKKANALIITDAKSNLAKIEEIIKSLDKITQQVTIEAKIIETTLGSTEKLGIDWTTIVKVTGAKRPTFFPFLNDKINRTRMFPQVQVPNELDRVTTTTVDAAGNTFSSEEEKVWSTLARGFPAVSADKFTFGTLDFSTFQMILEFLKVRAGTKIVASPRITTLNNEEANIFVGRVVPVPTYAFSKETGTQVISGYSDQKVGIKLIVTPNINERGYITLYVNPSVDEVIGTTGPNGERPVISSRSAETNVMIQDGQTLIIGGLISENKTKSKKGIPILGEIPILDLLFGNKANRSEKTELIIFITPHIVKEEDFKTAELLSSEKMAGKGENLTGGTEKAVAADKRKIKK